MNSNPVRILGVCILLMAPSLHAAATPEEHAAGDRYASSKRDVQEEPEPDRSHRTILFNLKRIDCTNTAYRHTMHRFRNELPLIPYLTLVQYRDMHDALRQAGATTECHDETCALHGGEISGAHRVLTGFIRCEVIHYLEPLGSEGKYQYIMKKKRRVEYTLEIALHDVEKARTLVVIQKKVDEKELDAAIDDILEELKKYFFPRPIPRVSEKGPVIPVLSFFLSGFAPPGGKLKKIIRSGYGVTLEAGLADAGFSGSRIMISAGAYLLGDTQNKVKRFHTFPFCLMIGYGFNLFNGKAYILPLFGGGYQIHYIDDASLGKKRAYGDPCANARLEIGYNVHSNIFIAVYGGYGMFFEKKKYGHYATFGAGCAYHFR